MTVMVLQTLGETGAAPASVMIPRTSLVRPFDPAVEGVGAWRRTPQEEARVIVRRNNDEPVTIDLRVQRDERLITIGMSSPDEAAAALIGTEALVALVASNGSWRWDAARSRGIR